MHSWKSNFWKGMIGHTREQLNLEKLLKVADPEEISTAVSEQVALLGSYSLYERMDNNFKLHKSEAIFAKVTFIL